MAFGSEVDDGTRLMSVEQLVEQGAVIDVAFDEDMAQVAGQRLQVGQVAGVGQRVEVDDALVALREPVEHEVAADETGAAGDKNGHRVWAFMGWHALLAAIRVFEANDIVFAEVAARLHFDDLQWHLAGVGQAVCLPKRNISALVF